MRRTTRPYENTELWLEYPFIGKYEFPIIAPISWDEVKDTQLIGFNYAMSTKKARGDYGLHFYLDDYQFERVWRNPRGYLPTLSAFKYVLAPDFSMYTDYPKIMGMYSHYKKHWCAAFWQAAGIKAVPSISWMDKESYEWCFDGEPERSVVSVSSVGCNVSKDTRAAFNDGFREMLNRLEPTHIIFYGRDILDPDIERGNIEFHKADSDERFSGKNQ